MERFLAVACAIRFQPQVKRKIMTEYGQIHKIKHVVACFGILVQF